MNTYFAYWTLYFFYSCRNWVFSPLYNRLPWEWDVIWKDRNRIDNITEFWARTSWLASAASSENKAKCGTLEDIVQWNGLVINLEKRQFLRFGNPHNWTKYRNIMQHHLPHWSKLSKKWHDQSFCPIVLVKCLENECKYCRCRLILSLYLNIIFQTSASFEVHA